MRAPPTGFAPMPPRGPFLEANGPFYHDGGTRFGFVPETRHLNVLGFVHGGLLSTLMDSAMAHCAVAAHGHAVVTEALSLQFQAVVVQGRWAEVEVVMGERRAEAVEVHAELRSRGSVGARAEGRFRLLLSRPVAAGGVRVAR